jgi:hypothetical protein
MLLLPADLQAGGAVATLQALADPAGRAACSPRAFSEQSLRRLVLGAVPDDWSRHAGLTSRPPPKPTGAGPARGRSTCSGRRLQVGATSTAIPHRRRPAGDQHPPAALRRV